VHARLEVIVRTDFVLTREAEWLKRRSEIEVRSSKPGKRTPNSHLRPPISEPPAPISEAAPAFLPAAYIAESAPRIQAYRRLAEVTTQEQLDTLRKTWRDRFGPLPEAAENLLAMTAIKLAANSRKITVVEARDGKLILTRGGDYVQIAGKFPRLTAPAPSARLAEMLAMIRSL
jgi:transcription-repair coupling factor (superfamily II helicase)